MRINPKIVDEIAGTGIVFDGTPGSLCANHARHVCFVATPGSFVCISGMIIGCELVLSGEGYRFKVEIDKKEIMDQKLIYFQYDGNLEWLAIADETMAVIKGQLIFIDLE